jgi:hypothetical protein
MLFMAAKSEVAVVQQFAEADGCNRLISCE